MEITTTVVNNSLSFNDSCSDIMMGRNNTLDLFHLIIFLFILLFGTIFNSTGISVFYFKMKTYTETRVFIMSLLLSDFCLLFTIPFRIFFLINKYGYGQSICQTVLFSYFLNLYSSIAIITLISVDRYLAIKFPLKSRILRSPTKAAVACGIVWLLLCASQFGIVYSGDLEFVPGFCFQKVIKRPLKRSLYLSILGFYIPLPIVIFCSVEIIRTLKKKSTTTVYEQQCIKKSIYLVLTNLIVFIVCFLPLQIGNVARFVIEYLKLDCTHIKNINDFVYAVQPVADLNCCLDAIYYYLVATEFSGKLSNSKQVSITNPLKEQTQETHM
ncbi:G-protein coupled receptor 35 [Bombina bombina]|uniref:G-protein coupled receptor 35 n=1 Tax=Bombina bombina TaxID=8345 RepID=UPI00235AD2D8|nr:G-protein coupled receptor 35 [Bombina bombina]